MISKPFSLLIKPASADCNLNCAYCFYLGHSSLYPRIKVHRMSDQVLEKLISSYLRTNQPQYSFGWQGGEPTLMGLDFFKRVIQLQQKHGHPGANIANGLQTNAIRIDDEFAKHLSKYNFLVGVSLDGPPEIHDYYRKYKDNRGTHADVMRSIDCLKRNNVEFNILTLVNNINVCQPKEVYHYLCDNGFLYHQYIECVEFDPKGRLLPFAVNGEEWGNFLCAIFDEWIKGDTHRVSIRLFDSILVYMVEGLRNVCKMGQNCCQYLAVEYNGDVYPCDFFI
ncbi:MAG: radical SAM protein, partial [Candidatus Omnitrophica bacterium]|nr:radical SAM protein [Candidatus Omnitrophota bacterium]